MMRKTSKITYLKSTITFHHSALLVLSDISCHSSLSLLLEKILFDTRTSMVSMASIITRQGSGKMVSWK